MAGDPPPYGCGMVWPPYIAPTPSPRVMPLNLPFSSFGLTVATMDSDGNVTIKLDRPRLDLSDEERHAVGHAQYQVNHATDEKPEVSFDFTLVQTLLGLIERLGGHG